MGAGDAKSTLTRWRVLRRLHDPLRVLDRVHLRRNDAGRADVERAFDVHLVARRQADDARRGRRGLHQRLHLCGIKRRMFGVDEQPVEAHFGEELDRGR